MTDDRAVKDLVGDLEQSLALLNDYRAGEGGDLPVEPLPSLLEQCLSLTAEPAAPEPLRSIHHFACSGGTLITKGLAAMPNIVAFSEIDPLSLLMLDAPGNPPRFSPADLVFWLRNAARPVDEGVLIDVFCAGLLKAHERLSQSGRQILIRDHAHSQFCSKVDPDARPTVHEILAGVLPVLSVVTVRHPLDSFLSLRRNDWIHFKPATLEEYSLRYLRFLDRHAGLPVVKYEDFVEDPEAILKHLSDLLQLSYTPMALELLPVVRISGGSGRAGAKIAPRPRLEVPEALEKARSESPAYAALCDRLSYEP
jgi:hypothetical protein